MHLKVAAIFCISALILPVYGQSQPQEQTPQQMQATTAEQSDSVDHALRLYRQKRYSEAIDEFNRIVQAEPNNAAAYYFMGYAHYVLHHLPEALSSFQKAFQADPNFDPRPYFQRR